MPWGDVRYGDKERTPVPLRVERCASAFGSRHVCKLHEEHVGTSAHRCICGKSW